MIFGVGFLVDFSCWMVGFEWSEAGLRISLLFLNIMWRTPSGRRMAAMIAARATPSDGP